jgi:fimbrial chaperone protein
MRFLSPRGRASAFVGLFASLALCHVATTGWAGNFQVNPTQVFLSAKTSSALLTLRNDSDDPLRFQLSIFAWNQSSQGEVLLKPTDDVVFFPSLVIVAPGDERKIRVGALTPTTSSEKTYRIFVEELPSMKPKVTETGSQVRVLTRLGIPIFHQPDTRKIEGSVDEMALRNGQFSFRLKNTGNVHFVPQGIRVRGYGHGETLFERELEAWYILADGLKVYELDVPKYECAKISTVAVEVKVAESMLKETFDIPPGSCSK